MDATLKNCVLVSVLIHFLVAYPAYNSFLSRQDAARRDHIVVDYIKLEEPRKTEARRPGVNVRETPRVEVKQKVETTQAPVAPAAKAGAKKETPQELAKKQARIRSTKDYINYYQLIREKIRQRLKSNYRRYHGEGDVGLVFILRSNGSLEALDIERASSTKDASLIDIAVSSLRQASPLPPFPKALAIPKMAFNLTVSFKRE